MNDTLRSAELPRLIDERATAFRAAVAAAPDFDDGDAEVLDLLRAWEG
ncbi:hypothetical protein [Streptomyces sp. NPDC003717]